VLIRSRSRGAAVRLVRNGQFRRVYPAAAGSFDCTASNLITITQGSWLYRPVKSVTQALVPLGGSGA
jgi:hypothetical protein